MMDDFDDIKEEKESRMFKFNKESLKLLEIEEDINTTDWQRTKLHPGIAKYLVKAGMTTPTQIQKQALRINPDASSVICAETGSGKSFAYLLPLVQERLLQYKNPKQNVEQQIQWLVIVPTHELATQVQKQLQKVFGILLNHFNLCTVLVGGMSEEKQRRLIRRKSAIVIVTPGRAARLLTAEDLMNVKKVIIDEADRCLQAGQQSDDLKRLITITKRQALTLVSATIGLPVQLSEAGSLLDKNNTDKQQKLIKIKAGHNNQFIGQSAKTISQSITQSYIKVINYLGFSNLQINVILANNGQAIVNNSNREKLGFPGNNINPESMQIINQSVQEIWHYCNDKHDKFKVLTYILLTHNCPTIVFCESGYQCKVLCETYKLLGLPVAHLSGQQQQKQRYKAIEKLGSHEINNQQNLNSEQEDKQPEATILFTTDLGSRGIDTSVKLIVQYTAPVSVSSHIHRVGRCARQQSFTGQTEKIGVALSLISPLDDKQYKVIKEACYDNNFREKVLSIENYNVKLQNQLFTMAKCASIVQEERSLLSKEISSIKKAIQQEMNSNNLVNGEDNDEKIQQTAYDVLLNILNDKQRRKQIKLGSLYDQLTNNKHGYQVDQDELEKRYKLKERELNTLERQLKLQIYLHTQQSQKIIFEDKKDLLIIGQSLRHVELPQLPKIELNFGYNEQEDNEDVEKKSFNTQKKKQKAESEQNNEQELILEPQIQQLIDINPNEINYNAQGPKLSRKMQKQQDKLNKKQEFAQLRRSTDNLVTYNEFQTIAKAIADEVDPDFMIFGPKEQRVKKMSNYKGKKKVTE